MRSLFVRHASVLEASHSYVTLGLTGDWSARILGLARRQVMEMAVRATEARWSAHDPSLPPVANANTRFRAA